AAVTAIVDTMGAGKSLRIEFTPETRSAVIQDPFGNILPSLNAFRFAWYAFHPDTLIYRAQY
ncbi:MAG TPA: hypothetical protein QF623_03330, partial [SAR324 cluster bacterium]|nr:hypothetical protein [SAR324 cluster bacterium]